VVIFWLATPLALNGLSAYQHHTQPVQSSQIMTGKTTLYLWQRSMSSTLRYVCRLRTVQQALLGDAALTPLPSGLAEDSAELREGLLSLILHTANTRRRNLVLKMTASKVIFMQVLLFNLERRSFLRLLQRKRQGQHWCRWTATHIIQLVCRLRVRLHGTLEGSLSTTTRICSPGEDMLPLL